MARYTYQWTELWRERSTILDEELEQLQKYLHKSRLDEEFDLEQHVYAHESGDRWLFLPELTEAQLFAATLILSSSELYLDDKPIRFDTPPATLRNDK